MKRKIAFSAVLLMSAGAALAGTAYKYDVMKTPLAVIDKLKPSVFFSPADPKTRRAGLSPQQTATVFPEAAAVGLIHRGVDPDAINALLILAAQDDRRRLTRLEAQNKKMVAQIAALQTALGNLTPR